VKVKPIFRNNLSPSSSELKPARNRHEAGSNWFDACIMPVSCGIMSQSEAELLYDWQFTANQFVLATSPLRLTASNFIFQLNTCGYRPYVTFSLTRV
jgi:hypothetical protein